MTRYLAPETPTERALWCVEHHRTHELDLRGLGPDDLRRVRLAVRAHRREAYRALARAQAVAAIAVTLLGAVIYLSFGIGPAAAVTKGSGGHFTFHLDDAAVLWLPMLALLVVVAFTGDRLVRSRAAELRRRRAVVEDLSAASRMLDAALASATT